ncbi:MAG: PilZ domain-containing protein [Pseudomonadota bacterium]
MIFERGRQTQNSGVLPLSPGKIRDTGIRVLLFVDDDISREKYLAALADCVVQVFVSASFFCLSEEISNQTYHGLILDLPTKMKAIKANKREVYRLVEKFPTAHVRVDGSTDEIRCFYIGLRQDGNALFDFINDQCCNSKPQKIRAFVRVGASVPVLLYRHPQSKRPVRSITLDISSGGCFIVTTHHWREGQEIFLRFPELSTITSVRAQIRTVVLWGKGRQIPGIGVKFLDLSMAQIDQLSGLWQSDNR